MYSFIHIYHTYICILRLCTYSDRSGHKKETPLALFGLRNSSASNGTIGSHMSSGGSGSNGAGASTFPPIIFRASSKGSSNGYENIQTSSGHGDSVFSIEGDDDNNDDDS